MFQLAVASSNIGNIAFPFDFSKPTWYRYQYLAWYLVHLHLVIRISFIEVSEKSISVYIARYIYAKESNQQVF
jgi:hypothetical protein